MNWNYRDHYEMNTYEPTISTNVALETIVGTVGVLSTITVLLIHKYHQKALNQQEKSIYTSPSYQEEFNKDNVVLLHGKNYAKVTKESHNETV